MENLFRRHRMVANKEKGDEDRPCENQDPRE